jgi:hypothetical protein
MKMKFLRQIATPLTIGAFLLMAVTGVLIFFHKATGLNKPAHEWLSWAFLLGVALHVVTNFKPFQIYFKKPLAIGIIGVFAAILTASFFLGGEKEGKGGRPPISQISSAIQAASIEQVAPIVGKTPDQLVAELNAKGFNATSTTQSLASVAPSKEQSNAVLTAVFGAEKGKQEGGKGEDHDEGEGNRK